MKDPILNTRYPELADYVILDGPIEKERIGGIVFCATNRLRELFLMLAKCDIEPITLITSQLHGTPFSDYNVDEGYTNKNNIPNNRISAWFTKNLALPDRENWAIIRNGGGARAIPIGIEPSKIADMADAEEEKRIHGIGKRYFLSAILDSTTNHGERTPVLHFAEKVPDSFVINTQPSSHYRMDFQTYIRVTRDSEFTLCPPGAGVDTWRMWEALYMGSIPVVKRGPMIEQFAVHGIPMLMYDFPEEIPEIVPAASGKIKPMDSNAPQLTFDYWANLIRRHG